MDILAQNASDVPPVDGHALEGPTEQHCKEVALQPSTSLSIPVDVPGGAQVQSTTYKARSPFQPPAVMVMPEFALEDTAAWREHLRVAGVVRIRSVLSPEEVEEAKSLFWDWLEALGGGVQRLNPQTWTNENFPGLLDKGFFCTRGGGQCSAAWKIRGNRRVHHAFQAIWGIGDLLTSFDTFIGWRPWWSSASSTLGSATSSLPQRPRTEGMHCDQNPHTKPGLRCVQGMVPLRPVTSAVGGLCVAPGTHTEEVQSRLRELFPSTLSDDWLPLELKYPQHELCRCGELVEAEPGDLILWDSRSLHGGYVGKGGRAGSVHPPSELARLSLAVCMVPRGEATVSDLHKRVRAVQQGHTLTHWPLGFKKQAGKDTGGSALTPLKDWQQTYRAPELDEWMLGLIGSPEQSVAEALVN
mmetsp:Transcript_109216/g.216883  ORF Transcript_109216/g.216883 Transcript_109216/m.216883 type:complete len:413 (-) Transcript_109216:313-1551(-)